MPKIAKALQDAIELTGMLMETDTTESTTCPLCGGGSNKDASFYITKLEDGALLFICHRASCGLKGRIARGGVGEVERKVSNKEKVKTKKELSVEKLLQLHLPSPPEQVQLDAKKKYNIDLEANFVRWTDLYSTNAPDSSPQEASLTSKEPKVTGRLAIPIFDDYWEVQGYDLKDIYKTQTPKSLIMKKPDYKGAAWYMVGYTDTPILIVVEDMLSAIAIKEQGIDAVALLGTHMTEDALNQINARKYQKVMVALDNDAITVATSIAASGTINNAELLFLDQDIKNMPLEARRKLLEPFKL